MSSTHVTLLAQTQKKVGEFLKWMRIEVVTEWCQRRIQNVEAVEEKKKKSAEQSFDPFCSFMLKLIKDSP